MNKEERQKKFCREYPDHPLSKRMREIEDKSKKLAEMEMLIKRKRDLALEKMSLDRQIRKIEALQRAEMMKRMKTVEKMSLDKIGKSFGLTRERVRQILFHHYGTTFKPAKMPIRVERSVSKCPVCTREFTHLVTQKKTYCSWKCLKIFWKRKTSDPAYKEYRKMYNRNKARWYYHEVIKKRPDWREWIAERNRKYKQKHEKVS